MVLKKGDFVRINFTGKIKELGEVFDTTYEDVAKANNIYEPNLIFKARPVVIGARHVLPGIDKSLVGAELGDKTTIDIAPEDGFGKRDPAKIKVIPTREFKKRGVDPAVGMHVELDDAVGRVQSVGGGRVRVDLNHGLAGKVLEYEVKIEEKVNKKEEKIRQLLELYMPGVDSQEFKITVKEKTVDIVLPDILRVDPNATLGQISAVRDIFTFIDAVDEVVYKDVHRRTAPSEKKKQKAQKQRRPKAAAKPKTESKSA